MRRLLATVVPTVLLAAGALSCGDTTTTSPGQLNFDRPIDVAFSCYGGLRITNGQTATLDQEIVTTAMPTRACDVRSGPHAASEPVPVPIGQEPLINPDGVRIAPPGASWYAFILQSGPGTVAIASFATKPSSAFGGGDVLVLDADPLTPGKNGISVGEDPIALASDTSGCYQVVANAGSCDLSVLDVNTALDSDSTSVIVNRTTIKNAAGQPMLARPAAMAAQPQITDVGLACPATPTGVVWLAYPSCHLVAAVDTATGTIVKGVQYDALGVPTMTDGNVSCPAECGGGGTVTSGVRPVTLDLEQDPRTEEIRLVIGADNSPSLTVVELGPDALPTSLRQVALEDTTGSLGVTHVALAPQLGAGGSAGIINDDIAGGGQFQFVYAITTDDTIRVADILSINKECDTQVDPRIVHPNRNIRETSCFPVGSPVTPPRRPGARGPGIELPTPGKATNEAIPTSIDIFRSDAIENDPRLSGPAKLIGYFGIITSATGATFVLNVDDDDYPDLEVLATPLDVQLPLAMPHQLRDALSDRALRASTTEDGMEKRICDTNGPDPDAQTGNYGGPRATGTPTRNVPAGFIAAEKVTELPSIRQVKCVGSDTTKSVSELGFAAPDDVRDLEFPDLRALRDETWTMTWEGSLSLDKGDADLDGPAVRASQIVVDGSGMRITDQSQPFCDAGVEQFDVVQLRGCDPSIGDAECPIGYSCYVHPNSQIAGLGACMLTDEADRLASACKDFLTSQRRYTVGRSASGELRLLPRKHVLPTTPLDGCIDDNQCKTLADLAVELTSSAHPIDDTTQPNARSYACLADPDRAALTEPGQTGKRCIETCDTTKVCSTGRICQIAASATQGICMEGVVPPQACVNAPQRYELRAHEAFTLVGTRSGYVHSTTRDPSTGKCIADPSAHPFEVGRIPLSAPACDPLADPRTGRLPDGTFEPNPCSLTVDQTEQAPRYLAGTCTPDSPTTELVTRPAPAIRIRTRGPTLTMVDPYYPGDDRCIRDRAGNLGKVPLTFTGYQLAWRQTGGFAPLLLPVSSAAFPIKVVRGPTQSVWVIDEGDYLSTSITQPSTRGKVFRLEIQGLGQVNLLE